MRASRPSRRSRPAAAVLTAGLVLALLAGCGLGGGSDAGPKSGSTAGLRESDASASADARATTGHPGGAALGRDPEQARHAVTTSSTTVVPARSAALEDKPDLYADGCQVSQTSSTPTGCVYGVAASRARATIAVVGDSKVGQWTPALQRLATQRRLRILVYTKSACSAVDATVTLEGRPYTSCRTYVRRVSAELARRPVDLILTDSSATTALPDGGGTQSRAAMVKGLQRLWSTWIASGNRVAVISDNPQPTRDDRMIREPSCIAKNPTRLSACSFERTVGIQHSGRAAQVEAVRAAKALDVTPAMRGRTVAGARTAPLLWIDPVPWLCPSSTCPAVIGNVGIYRDGSHVTRTYIHSLAPRIGDALRAAGL